VGRHAASCLRGRIAGSWAGETDLAPLGLFRIVYGVLLINWFWLLAPDLRAFFTEEGLLPRRALFALEAERFSILYLFADWWQVAVFWALCWSWRSA
jgi:hypothetical protein